VSFPSRGLDGIEPELVGGFVFCLGCCELFSPVGLDEDTVDLFDVDGARLVAHGFNQRKIRPCPERARLSIRREIEAIRRRSIRLPENSVPLLAEPAPGQPQHPVSNLPLWFHLQR
jgi:hypothetical protein